jgi:hypothetical protein
MFIRIGSTVDDIINVVSNNTIILVDGDVMTWILDNCATIHATLHRDIFTNYASNAFGVVKIRNSDGAWKSICALGVRVYLP